MTKRGRIITIGALSLAGLVLIAVIALLTVPRTEWFGDYLRRKIIASVEDSTGGKVDLAKFSFDWRTVTIDGFVIHGTEPPGSAPLFQAKRIVLKLKILASIRKIADFEYLGVEQPAANVMVFPNGQTNIPAPKTTTTNGKPALQTIVDLAIHRVDIRDGNVQFLNQGVPFSANGQNLKVDLAYDPLAARYQGQVSMNQVRVASADRPPLNVKIAIPVTLENDNLRITDARIETSTSNLIVNASLRKFAAPEISGDLRAHVALDELSRSVDLPIYPQRGSGPQALDALIGIQSSSNRIQIQNALVVLGSSRLEASGDVKSGAEFRGDLALGELGTLLRVQLEPRGQVQLAGKLSSSDAGYLVAGNIDARDVSFKQGNSRVRGIRMTSKFRVDTKRIEANDLKLFAAGGEVTAGARLDNLSTLTAKARLRGFQIQNVTTTFASKPLRYGGSISGTVEAQMDLKASGLTGLSAKSRLVIASAAGGTPLSGRINADYNGTQNVVSLNNSYLAFPNGRIDLVGELGRQAEVRLTSSNLQDFGPAIGFASSSTSPPSFPIRGGMASLVTRLRGPMNALQISGQASATNFAIGQRPFDLLAAEFEAAPSGIKLQNGRFTRNGFTSQFSASLGLRNWGTEPRLPLAANVTVRNGDLADVLALSGEPMPRASGLLNADVRISGTLGNPLGAAQISVVNGMVYDQPFDRFQSSIELSDQLVNLSSVELVAGMARIDLQGSLRHPKDSFTTGRVQVHVASNLIQLSQLNSLQKSRPGFDGTVAFDADVSGDLPELTLASVNANLNAKGVRDRAQNYGNLTATVRTDGTAVNARLNSDFAGSTIQVSTRTQLTRGYATTADASIRSLPVERALSLASFENQVPVRGMLAATAHYAGTVEAPEASLMFDLTNAVVKDEPVNRASGSLEYNNELVKIGNFEIDSPAGKIELAGSFSHPRTDFRSGKIEFHLASSGVDLRRVQNVQTQKPGLAGRLRLTADGSADLRRENGEMQILPSRIDVNGGATGIEWKGRKFGDASFRADTSGRAVTAKFDSDLGGSSIQGTAQVQLQGDYPTEAKLSFTNVTYAGLQGLLGPQPQVKPGFDALVEGQASVNGMATKLTTLRGEIRLTRTELSTAQSGPGKANSAKANKAVRLQNQGPIVARFDNGSVQIQSAHLSGPSTDISLAGDVALDKKGVANLTANGQVDLSLLRDFSPDLYSSGSAVLNATVRGSVSNPQLNGKIELKNASVQSADWPNGITKANGEILLNGTNLTIRSLSAESGGGSVALSGFASYTGSTVTYNLRVTGTQIRTRTSGVTIVTDSNLTLNGTSDRSVLAGNVIIDRVGYSQQSDIGSMLAGAAKPVETPAAPVGPIAGMRLNIRIQTAPDVQFQTTLAEGLSATANLTLQGTAFNPGMTGRVNVTRGALLFFGNKYAVNRGAVAFYNGNKIEPVLDLDLETSVKSVVVILDVTGPIDNLKLAYRSDPPLKFEEIVPLLATGKTPRDATIAAHQPADPELSASQMGESAILSQAVANPLANRLQRVFGVTQLKIDPTLNSGSVLPQARVTLQQQVSDAITFTYTQDLSQTNSQIIRVEWAMTPRFSAVATRDENGIFGLDFLYKKQFR